MAKRCFGNQMTSAMSAKLEFGKPIPQELLHPPKPPKEKPKAEMRNPSDDEALACSVLGQLKCPPASFDKRFCRNMENAEQISDRGAAQLWRIIYRYRRQIHHPRKAHLLKIAEDMKASDYRN